MPPSQGGEGGSIPLSRSKLPTKYRIPLRVLFTEEFETLAEARKRETWWKSGTGRRKLKEYFDSKTSN